MSKTVSIKDVSIRKSIVGLLDELDKELESAYNAAEALYDCDGEGMFDVPGAGEVLLTCEAMIFALRAAMFTAVNNDLGDNLISDIIAMVDEAVELRDLVADDLDEILDDTDAIIEDALGDLEDAFTIWVPVDAEVELDGESIDLADYMDEEEGGEAPIDILPGEVLVVDGARIILDECEAGEEYSLYDLDDEDEDGGELPDDSFTLRVPGGVEIIWDGKPWKPCIDTGDEDVGLVVGTDSKLVIDGEAVDLGDCEPGEEYRLEDGVVVLADSFLLRIPFDADIEVCGQPLEKNEEDNDDGCINLVATSDIDLTVDGVAVDLSGCEPGGEYDITVEEAE